MTKLKFVEKYTAEGWNLVLDARHRQKLSGTILPKISAEEQQAIQETLIEHFSFLWEKIQERFEQ